MQRPSASYPTPPSLGPMPRARRSRDGVVSAKQLKGNTIFASMVLILGLIIAGFVVLSAPTPEEAFSRPAPIIAIALLLSTFVELRGGLRNVVRIDLFMLMVLYLLTFLEFLFPQENLRYNLTLESAKAASTAAILGFAGITIGRLMFVSWLPVNKNAAISVRPNIVFGLLLFCTFFGYLYMLLAVNFDIMVMIDEIQQPRFTQPWVRGRFGGISTLLNEIGLLKFLIAPLAGAMLAQASRYKAPQLCVAIILCGFVFFESFASGTRNVFLSNVMTFGTAYTLLMRRPSIINAIKIWVPIILISAVSIEYMLQVRTFGLAGMSEVEPAPSSNAVRVDMNLVNVAVLTDSFPDRHEFLGLEIPMLAAVRPIPRALWSGKPEGMSVSIEEVLGVGENMTLSATFIGEFWMAGGYPAIIIMALIIGVVAGFWNRLGANASSASQMILFAAAFYPAGIAMRSFMSIGPALLPVIGLAVLLLLLKPKRKRRFIVRRPPHADFSGPRGRPRPHERV